MAVAYLHENVAPEVLATALDEHLVDTLNEHPSEAENVYADQIIDAAKEACEREGVEMNRDEFAAMVAGLYVGIRLGRTLDNVVSN